MIPEKLFFSAVFRFVQAAIKTIHQHLQGYLNKTKKCFKFGKIKNSPKNLLAV